MTTQQSEIWNIFWGKILKGMGADFQTLPEPFQVALQTFVKESFLVGWNCGEISANKGEIVLSDD